MVDLGLPLENIWVPDLEGVVFEGRSVLKEPDKERFAQKTEARKLAEVIQDADVFLGLSAGGVLKPEMVATMGPRPLILALANPTPEILPELAHSPGQQRAVLPIHLPRRAGCGRNYHHA
ncbi:hypothetical protein G6F59_017708 [Rhizopus arrhizus]|nr:hypothetical protein G6F59_017708 [Rhizopus arrhizus]